MNVTDFPARPSGDATPAPGEPPPAEAFAVIANSNKGLVVGAVVRHRPPGMDDDTFFRGVVESVFNPLPGFGFGIVLGDKSLA